MPLDLNANDMWAHVHSFPLTSSPTGNGAAFLPPPPRTRPPPPQPPRRLPLLLLARLRLRLRAPGDKPSAMAGGARPRAVAVAGAELVRAPPQRPAVAGAEPSCVPRWTGRSPACARGGQGGARRGLLRSPPARRVSAAARHGRSWPHLLHIGRVGVLALQVGAAFAGTVGGAGRVRAGTGGGADRACAGTGGGAGRAGALAGGGAGGAGGGAPRRAGRSGASWRCHRVEAVAAVRARYLPAAVAAPACPRAVVAA